MTLFITSLSVWKVVTNIFKQHCKKNCLFSLSHHYTEQISPIESTASVGKNGDCASEVDFITEGQVQGGESPEMAGRLWFCPWEGEGFAVCVLYCKIGATLFPFVCICIDFLVYDIYPCQDLFIFF